MKLIVDRATFGNRLKLAMSAVKARTPIPQLQCVHGVAKRRSLEIRATDGEVGVRIPCNGVDVIEDGEFLVNADRLSSIVSVDGSQAVTIESDGERIRVSGKSSKFSVSAYNPEDFPWNDGYDKIAKSKDVSAKFTCAAADLSVAIDRTVFCANEGTFKNFATGGVYLNVLDGSVDVVATNGTSMGRDRLTAQCEKSGSAFVPIKAANMLAKIADYATALAGDESVNVMAEVVVTPTRIGVRIGDIEVVSALVEGTFVPYDQILRQESPIAVQIGRLPLIDSLRAASVMISDPMSLSRCVRFAFSTKGLKLSNRAPETGETYVECPISVYSGESVEVGLDPRPILEALTKLDSMDVKLELSGNLPVILNAGAYLYLQSTMKIPE